MSRSDFFPSPNILERDRPIYVYEDNVMKMDDVELCSDTESSDDSFHGGQRLGKNNKFDGGKTYGKKSKRSKIGLYGWVFWAFIVSTCFFLLGKLTLHIVNRNEHYVSSELFELRINSGSDTIFTDIDGNVWLADQTDKDEEGFAVFGDDSNTYDHCPAPIAMADDIGEGLYCNERYFKRNGGYEVFVPFEGTYEVTLYFAETFFSAAGERIFDVSVENEVFSRDFDIIDTAGANYSATKLSGIVNVNDGAVTIEFISKVEFAKISGISVVLVDAQP